MVLTNPNTNIVKRALWGSSLFWVLPLPWSLWRTRRVRQLHPVFKSLPGSEDIISITIEIDSCLYCVIIKSYIQGWGGLASWKIWRWDWWVGGCWGGGGTHKGEWGTGGEQPGHSMRTRKNSQWRMGEQSFWCFHKPISLVQFISINFCMENGHLDAGSPYARSSLYESTLLSPHVQHPSDRFPCKSLYW